jgi:hypothetical protein
MIIWRPLLDSAAPLLRNRREIKPFASDHSEIFTSVSSEFHLTVANPLRVLDTFQ